MRCPLGPAAREDVDRLSSHTLKYSVFLAFLSLKCLNPHPNRFPEAVLDCTLGGMGRAGVRLWNLVAQSPGTAKQQFRREVQKELTARETEASELVYFKLYKSEIPLSSRRSKTAAFMLDSDKSRGYCLEMICADFLAGANLDNQNP